jgi:hypothetical protein
MDQYNDGVVQVNVLLDSTAPGAIVGLEALYGSSLLGVRTGVHTQLVAATALYEAGSATLQRQALRLPNAADYGLQQDVPYLTLVEVCCGASGDVSQASHRAAGMHLVPAAPRPRRAL